MQLEGSVYAYKLLYYSRKRCPEMLLKNAGARNIL